MLQTAINRITAFGVKIQVTEFDVTTIHLIMAKVPDIRYRKLSPIQKKLRIDWLTAINVSLRCFTRTQARLLLSHSGP